MMATLSTKRIRLFATSGPSTPEQTSSADVIGSNDDLLIEILLRLPIRSLLKFKSVSKHWLSLISNPHFSRRRNPNPNPVSGLFLPNSSCLDGPDLEFVPLDGKPSTPHPDLPAWICILQSCNGLLCCNSYQQKEDKRNYFYQEKKKEDKRNYYIYNPTTQQLTILPELGSTPFITVAGVILAFDPSKSPHYKVVCVRTDFPSCRYWIEIYSSESGSWRLSGNPFTHLNLNLARNCNFNRGVFWNGAVHWISNLGTMVSFDVNQERLRETPMPEILNDWNQWGSRYFGESRDHLHLILNYNPGTTKFNIYEMEKDYSRWFVKYQVDLDAVRTAFPDMTGSNFYSFNILCLVRKEIDEDSFLVLQIPLKAICYRFKDKTVKKLCDLAVSYGTYLPSGWQFAYQYVESLACV